MSDQEPLSADRAALRARLLQDYMRGRLINEAFSADHISPTDMDRLWAAGWRHFGCDFFRYNFQVNDLFYDYIVALRIALVDFRLSRAQRRTLRANADLTVQFAPAQLDDERRALFAQHAARFADYAPTGLDAIVSTQPASVPCRCVELTARDAHGQLLALSYLDVGAAAVSSVYAVFAPAAEARRLGIFTMLCELRYAAAQGMAYYYHGYATVGPSRYDYKRCFHGLQQSRFDGAWRPVARTCPGSV